MVNNYLIVPFEYQDLASFSDQIRETQAILLTVFEQIEYSNVDIQQAIREQGDLGKLFNLFFDYNAVSHSMMNANKSASRAGLQPSKIVNRILSCRVSEFEVAGRLHIRYRKAIFSKSSIATLAKSIVNSIEEKLTCLLT